MGKINGCLKCLFIFFNVLFGIFGVLLIVAAVKSSAYSQELSAAGTPSVGWNWVFAIGVLLVSCLGVFAACSERELLLKVFAGLMVVGLIIMMILGIVCAVYRNKTKAFFEDSSEEIKGQMMADESFKEMLKGIQTTYSCCGLEGAQDWGDTIPQSCGCGGYSDTCYSRPQGASGPDKIHSRSCGVVIFTFVDLFFKIAMGIFFTFAVTALLGLLVSLLMIRQIRRHEGGGGGQSIAMKGSGY